MNEIIVTLPQKIENTHNFFSSGCTNEADNLHFEAAGYRELDKHYADK